ncbi:unnamed protein product [Pleuronectes platessa]|uniref:Uncharacterized protein n=1 Tax=Pleuronectes platessa TaxID=8262 RepID=A0A9N7VDQ0_PLEPL|nr:unnamed protein product [Pleuronectes platessa]
MERLQTELPDQIVVGGAKFVWHPGYHSPLLEDGKMAALQRPQAQIHHYTDFPFFPIPLSPVLVSSSQSTSVLATLSKVPTQGELEAVQPSPESPSWVTSNPAPQALLQACGPESWQLSLSERD